MAVRATPPAAYNRSLTINASASPLMGPYRTCCHGNSLPNSAKFESCLAKLLWLFIQRRTNQRRISLELLLIALLQDRWRHTSARFNAFALRSRGWMLGRRSTCQSSSILTRILLMIQTWRGSSRLRWVILSSVSYTAQPECDIIFICAMCWRLHRGKVW